MKIMYVMDQLRLHGGVEKMLSAKINSLINDYQFEVCLVTSEQLGQPFIYSVDKNVIHIDLGINYLRDKSYFSTANLLKMADHRKKLKHIINDYNPDIIVSPSFTPDQYFLPFISGKIPTVKEIHFSGYILQPQKSPWSPRKLMERFFPKYSRVVVLNNDETKYYPSLRLKVIPNFVENKNPEKNKKEKIVIAAGRIAPVKQFDHLLRAWSLIEKKFPDWKLKIFGDGDTVLVDKLKKLSQDLGLKNADLPGATSEIEEEMNKSSVFALSSSTECFPMVLLEAKCAGLPVVSYDAPNGPRNIVEDRVDGFLVPPDNIEKLAESLGLLLGNEQLTEKMSVAALHNSVKFNKETIMAKWVNLFNELQYERKN